MNTLVKSVSAVAIAGAVALIAVAPASAGPVPPWWGHRHHHYVSSYYYPPPAPYPYYGYQPYYGYSPYYYDPGAAIVGGFIGSIFGSIAHHAIVHHRVVHR